jgi:tRNA(Ile)-lysidine synthase
MVSSFLRTIQKHKLIRENDRILIGVSGGPDSVCLLLLMNELRTTYGLTLYVAHLDHMLRARSSRDASFVQRLSERLGIPCCIERFDVKKAARGASLEQEARRIRYDHFFRLARLLKVRTVALGHNLDDQVETVLMRIIRGTGLYGLIGILPRRDFDGISLIRPLIGTERAEIMRFLKKRKAAFVRDETNQSDDFLRNRIRRTLLPLLETYNPNIRGSLINLAKTSARDYEYIRMRAAKALRTLCVCHARTVVKLDRALLNRHDEAVQGMVFRLAYEKVRGDLRRLTYQHWLEVKDLMESRPVGSVVDLPERVSVLKDKRSIILRKK